MMKQYEVTIDERANSIWCNGNLPVSMIVSAENKKQAMDFAFEIFQPQYNMSRGKVKITAERFDG